jgi:uncharacterized protein with PQ loop repeat
MSDIIGFVAFLITVTYTCFGLPAQIRKNYVNKSTAGIPLVTMVLLFFTFSSWVVYGLIKPEKDWYIVGSNFPGAVFVAVMLCQFWIYRRNKPN